MLLFSSVVGSTASTSLSGQTPSRSISSKRLVPSPLNCSACPAWCCRMISVVNCDDLALYRRISLYRRFLSSGFSLSTSAAIILPWYTMDLKNLEAFLPAPRQASERVFVLLLVPNEVVPLTLSSVSDVCMTEANASFDTSSTLVDSNETTSFFISSHKRHTIWERCRCFFLEPIAREYTEQYKCLAMRCLLSYYDILYLLHIIIHGLLCGTGSMWIQVSKSIQVPPDFELSPVKLQHQDRNTSDNHSNPNM